MTTHPDAFRGSVATSRPEARARQRKRRRWAWRIAVSVLLGITALLLVRAWLPTPELVTVGTVIRGPLRVVVTEQGRTRFRERYVVTAPVSGELERIALNPGDPLRSGTRVARIRGSSAPLIDSRQALAARARVDAAQAIVSKTRAEVDHAAAARSLALAEWDRVRSLHASAAATPEDLDRADAEFRSASAALEAARAATRAAHAELAAARAMLAETAADAHDHVHVTTPAEGVVLSVPHRGPGFVVAGTPLLEVGDPTTVEYVVGLLTRDASRVRMHGDALVDAGNGHTWPARIRRIDPSGYTRLSALGVEEQRVDVVLDASDDEPHREPLGDGFRVDVSLTAFDAPDALRAPASAIFRIGEGWGVFVIEDGIARRRRVAIGEHNDRDVAIDHGLAEGQRVILHPSDRVRDGVAVLDAPIDR